MNPQTIVDAIQITSLHQVTILLPSYKADMCGMLAPVDAAPMDALAAFAKWTLTHYGDLANQCYYSTSCLSDASQKDQWYNQKTWVWQCCSQLAYWQVIRDGRAARWC